MERELRPVVRQLRLRRQPVAGLPSWRGAARAPVVAAAVGVGSAVAGPATERLLAAVGVERALVVGIAGSVDPALTVGEVLRPDLVVDRSSGSEHSPHGPGKGLLVTCDRPGGTDTLPPGTSAVDMETAAIAAACDRHGVPWVALRAISDVPGTVDERVLRLTRPDGSTDALAVARLLARRPWEVRRLARLGRDTRLALVALTGAILAEL